MFEKLYKKYKLLIMDEYGSISRHYYNDYDELEYDANMCPFSGNVIRVKALKRTGPKWKLLFTMR